MRRGPIPLASMFLCALVARGVTCTVTNTNDGGSGSLRQAILDASANPGADTIPFDAMASGVQTIPPATALRTITEVVTIDGYTQPNSSVNTDPVARGQLPRDRSDQHVGIQVTNATGEVASPLHLRPAAS